MTESNQLCAQSSIVGSTGGASGLMGLDPWSGDLATAIVHFAANQMNMHMCCLVDFEAWTVIPLLLCPLQSTTLRGLT